MLSRPHAKRGTKNSKQAVARDKLAAEAATAAALAAAEAMADLASPGAQQQTTPATGGQRRQRDNLQEERRRQAVIFKYEQLGRPQQEMWDGLGGTVAQIRA